MKTLIFNGSPRKSGDTAFMINRLCQTLDGEIKIIDAYYSDISPCTDCRYCKAHLSCSINDEMNEVYRYIEECDNIVIASSVYFSLLTGELMSVFSRLQMYFCTSYFQGKQLIEKKKRGGVILSGGGNGSPENAYKSAADILKLMQAKEVFSIVGSFNTDDIPPESDKKCLNDIIRLSDFLNRKD